MENMAHIQFVKIVMDRRKILFRHVAMVVPDNAFVPHILWKLSVTVKSGGGGLVRVVIEN